MAMDETKLTEFVEKAVGDLGAVLLGGAMETPFNIVLEARAS
jgi:hypothetical protein